MKTNIILFHDSEVRTVTFLSDVKPERWNKILNKLDDLARQIVERMLGERHFDYSKTWRTNNDVIGTFIACLFQAKVDK